MSSKAILSTAVHPSRNLAGALSVSVIEMSAQLRGGRIISARGWLTNSTRPSEIVAEGGMCGALEAMTEPMLAGSYV